MNENSLNIEKFRFGIEHEFPVINKNRQFCDFTNTSFEDFNRVIENMPVFDEDYKWLRVGDLKIKLKRWYIEGFERFNEKGTYLYTDIKGFEIRTPVYFSIEEVVSNLKRDFEKWKKESSVFGYKAAWTSFNPYQEEYILKSSLNNLEIANRKSPEEKTAYMHMLTSGPDINFSHPDLTQDKAVDIAQKFTFYSPFIVPFSFSSPFYKGSLWGGFSRRTYYRTGKRPAAMVFVGDKKDLIESNPTLTDFARIPSEAGRIEFKAFDTPLSIDAYYSLTALLLGIILDDSLKGRLIVPDKKLHEIAAEKGFEETVIFENTKIVLEAAQKALPENLKNLLKPLVIMLENKKTPAHAMIEKYNSRIDIIDIIQGENGK